MANYPGALNPAPNVVVVPVPAQQWIPKNDIKYSEMKAVAAVRTFGILSIVIGLPSIGIQIALLDYDTIETYDDVGYGIWAGVFYMICGGLCLGAASKKTKDLIISSLVFAFLSAASAIAASVLSGLSTNFPCTYYYYVTCDKLYSLYWSLMGFSIYAFCNSVVLIVLMSVAWSSGKPKNGGQNNGQPAAYFTPGGFPQGWQPNVGAVNVGYQGFVALPSGVQAVPTAPAVPSGEHVHQQVERQV